MSYPQHTDAGANSHWLSVGKAPLRLGHHVLNWMQNARLEQLSDLQGELQAQARRGYLEVSTQELAELVEPVEDRVAVKPERRGGVFDRAPDEIRLQRFQQLAAVAYLGVDQAA